MKTAMETFGDVLVVHTPEEVNGETAAQMLQALRSKAEGLSTQIVLQMDRTELIDSAGLECLLDLQDELQDRGGIVKISSPADVVQTIFKITRFDQRFDQFASVVDAVGSFD